MWRGLLGIGRSALGGGGLYFVLGAFALGALPSLWLGLSLLGARADLVHCERARAQDAVASRDFVLSEAERLNNEARRAADALRTIRDGSDDLRRQLETTAVDCDLGPVRDGLQQHLDTVREAREAAAAGGTE